MTPSQTEPTSSPESGCVFAPVPSLFQGGKLPQGADRPVGQELMSLGHQTGRAGWWEATRDSSMPGEECP